MLVFLSGRKVCGMLTRGGFDGFAVMAKKEEDETDRPIDGWIKREDYCYCAGCTNDIIHDRTG